MSRARRKAQVSRDRRNIARLYLQGKTQGDIAEELKISQATISRDLTAIQKEWAKANLNDIDERKRNELAKIDNLELIYWDGWVRSQANSEVETTKMQGAAPQGTGANSPAPNKVERVKRVEGQVGDPKFLSGVSWCINKRCELLGLNAPANMNLTNAGMPFAITDGKIVIIEHKSLEDPAAKDPANGDLIDDKSSPVPTTDN